MDKFIKMTYSSLQSDKADLERLDTARKELQERIEAQETFLKLNCKNV